MDETMSSDERSLALDAAPVKTHALPLSAHHDASNSALLPEGAPLDMPEQSFAAGPMLRRRSNPQAWIARTAVFFGAALAHVASTHD